MTVKTWACWWSDASCKALLFGLSNPGSSYSDFSLSLPVFLPLLVFFVMPFKLLMLFFASSEFISLWGSTPHAVHPLLHQESQLFGSALDLAALVSFTLIMCLLLWSKSILHGCFQQCVAFALKYLLSFSVLLLPDPRPPTSEAFFSIPEAHPLSFLLR